MLKTTIVALSLLFYMGSLVANNQNDTLAVTTNSETSEKEKDFFFSISKSHRTNSEITVSAKANVLYDNSNYQTIQLSKAIFDDYNLGILITTDEKGQDILGYAGTFTTKNLIVSIEKTKLSGVISSDDTERLTLARFDDNNYLDLKILYKPINDGVFSISNGIQYLSYERANVLKINNRNYIDTNVKTQFLGFVMELDSVKGKLLENKIKSGNDWYFYSTTALGIAQVKLSSSSQYIGSGYTNYSAPINETPNENSWIGLGINGEYELGYVRYQTFNNVTFAFKLGYALANEAPLMFHKYSFDDDTIIPDAALTSHGLNFSIMGVF